MKNRRGIFILIFGILWLAATIAVPYIGSWAEWIRSQSILLSWFGVGALEWHEMARFILYNALLYGYREALLMILLGIALI